MDSPIYELLIRKALRLGWEVEGSQYPFHLRKRYGNAIHHIVIGNAREAMDFIGRAPALPNQIGIQRNSNIWRGRGMYDEGITDDEWSDDNAEDAQDLADMAAGIHPLFHHLGQPLPLPIPAGMNAQQAMQADIAANAANVYAAGAGQPAAGGGPVYEEDHHGMGYDDEEEDPYLMMDQAMMGPAPATTHYEEMPAPVVNYQGEDNVYDFQDQRTGPFDSPTWSDDEDL